MKTITVEELKALVKDYARTAVLAEQDHLVSDTTTKHLHFMSNCIAMILLIVENDDTIGIDDSK